MNPKIRDLPGLVVGRLRPIEPLPTVIGRKTVWRCACACGRSAFVRQDHLVKGRTQSCGCLVRRDFHGQQIGHLRVLQPGPRHNGCQWFAAAVLIRQPPARARQWVGGLLGGGSCEAPR